MVLFYCVRACNSGTLVCLRSFSSPTAWGPGQPSGQPTIQPELLVELLVELRKSHASKDTMQVKQLNMRKSNKNNRRKRHSHGFTASSAPHKSRGMSLVARCSASALMRGCRGITIRVGGDLRGTNAVKVILRGFAGCETLLALTGLCCELPCRR